MTKQGDRQDGGTNSIEQLRLQLLANGYSPIPNLDKRTPVQPDVYLL